MKAQQPKQNSDVHKNVFLLFLLHHLRCTTTDKRYAKTQLIHMAGPSDIVCYPKSWGYLFIAICWLLLRWEKTFAISKFFCTPFLLRTSHSSRIKNENSYKRTNNKATHRFGKLCFSGYQAKKIHCKGISRFIKHQAHSKTLKNFACGTDSALIEEVLIWCPFSMHSKLQLQNHLLVHFSSSQSCIVWLLHILCDRLSMHKV